MKALRGKKSAQQIANRTKELGYPISRATLSQLENGTRKAPTVPELLVIAAALDTSPAMLVFGEGLVDGDPVDTLPEQNESAISAFYWFAGVDNEPTDTALRRGYLGDLANPNALAEAIADRMMQQGVRYFPEHDSRLGLESTNGDD